MKTEIYEMLKASATSDKYKALLTLKAFDTNLSAIGDHTTGDLYENLETSLALLIDANDRLEMIEKLKNNQI